MPADLIENYGYIEFTPEVKRKILGENYCRMHGLDLQELKASIPDDDWRKQQLANDFEPPWQGAALEAV
jgi:hypothetical protein